MRFQMVQAVSRAQGLLGGLASILFLGASTLVGSCGLESIVRFLKSYETHYSITPGQENFLFVLDSKTNPTESLHHRLTSLAPKLHQPKKIELYAYCYVDIPTCNQAYDSLLNCFPSDCFKLPPYKTYDSYKIVPSIVIKNGAYIVAATISCSDTVGWWDFKNKLKLHCASPQAQIIETECGGPLWWTPARAQ